MILAKVKYYLKQNRFLLNSAQLLYDQYKSIKKQLSQKSKPIGKDELIRDFKFIGLRPNDVVVVVSSMSSIGLIDGGATTFINALKEYIGKNGVIVMPSYPHRGMYDYLTNYQVFDVTTTPSMNGIITEVFRTSEGVYRSLHPTHPICIWGKDAKDLIKGHELTKSPYDFGSPYEKFLKMNARNLCIGVDFDHMIMIRIIDDLYPDYPVSMYMHDKTFKVSVKDYEGNLVEIETKCHDPEISKTRFNMRIFPYLKDFMSIGRIGRAKSILIDSQILFNKQIELSKQGIFPYHIPPWK